jgi:tetratricopeptide (TPR) repeat protein
VVEYDPNDSSAFINIATCYNALDQNVEALDYFNRAFSINPNWKKGTYVNSEYGFLLVEMGELEQAKETFEIMLDSKDTKARGLRSLALLNTYTGNFSKAIDYFKEAVLLNKSANILLSEYRDRLFLARAYRVKGMKAEFLNEVSEVDSLIGKMDLSPAWLAKAGLLYTRNNMLDKAEEILVKIENNIGDIVATSGVNRNINEDQAFYHLIKGEIALANARHDEAIESLKLAHNIIEFPESLAHVHYKAGNLDTAAEYYREVVREKAINREEQLRWIMAHYQLGKIYEQQQKTDEAVKYYEQFINIWKDADNDIVTLNDAESRLRSLKS